jgi:hypothetical protein
MARVCAKSAANALSPRDDAAQEAAMLCRARLAWETPMQDLLRDWRRWRIEERVVAVLLLALALVTPILLALAA